MNNQELIAEARRVAVELSRRPGDRDRLVRELLKQLADLAEGKPGYLAEAAAEVRAMLAANAARYKELLLCDSPEGVLQAVRAERLTIIDRLVAIAAAASGGRCPPCDGDLPAEED